MSTEIEIKHVAFDLKGLDAKTGEFSGYGSTFGNKDFGGDIVVKGAFAKTIAEHKSADSMPAMLFGHDTQEPIGDWMSMSEDSNGLLMTGKLWIGVGIPKAEQAYRMMAGKGGRGLSIGYVTRDSSVDKKGVRSLIDLDLKEVSPTPFPMNPRATVSAVKSLLAGFTKRELEQTLRDAGLSISQAKSLLATGWKGIDPRDADSDVAESQHAIAEQLRNTIRILKG